MEDARRTALPSTTLNRSAVDITSPEKAPRSEQDGSRAPAAHMKDLSGDIKPRDKRSADYVIRSGLAGGIAGCVVSCVVQLKANKRS